MSDIYKSLIILFFIISFNGFSQIKTPQPSPSSELEQM
ncbi:uncharacterized protein METZ01_LOCUS105869, partial [marine metagenome]